MFRYSPPSIPVSLTMSFSGERDLGILTRVNKIDSFSDYVRHYKDTDDPPTPFNFYDILEIPPKSILPYRDIPKISEIIRTYYFGSNKSKMNYYSSSIGEEGSSGVNNIIFNYNVYSDGRGYLNNSFIGSSINKIHLNPKDDYLLYVILKLDTFANIVKQRYPYNSFRFKFTIFTYTTRKMTKEETYLKSLEVNGGITGNIVIYGSSNPVIMTFLLQGILDLFKGQEDLLGEMDITEPNEIPPFNIRLNPLIAYAAGDRGSTLDYMIRKLKGTSTHENIQIPFEIPRWLLDKQQEMCATRQDELNADTRVLLGINVCRNNAPIDLIEDCSVIDSDDKKYCFIQRKGNPILNPFPFYEDFKRRNANPMPTRNNGFPNLPRLRRLRLKHFQRAGKRTRRHKKRVSRTTRKR